MANKKKQTQKKKRTGLRITIGALIVCVLAIGGAAGYYAIQHMQEQKRASAQKEQIEEATQKEVASMQKVYKQWAEALDTDTIYRGVSAMGIELGGMTKEEATEALSDKYSSDVLDKKVTLTMDETKWEYTYRDLGFTANVEEIAESAYGLYRTGAIRERYNNVQALSTAPVDLMLTDDYDASRVETILDEIAEQVYQEPKDAEATYTTSGMEVTEEVVGRELDMDATKKALQEAVADQQDVTVELVVKETKPEKTAESLAKMTDILGTFSTNYSMSNYNRNRNLEVGVSRITGTVVMPGEEFNYNNTVSPIDYASGYLDASTLVGGQYVQGIAGGLCQVSTTLYNAVIRAELEVTERWCHGRDPGYVPNGMDAAIFVGGINFRFVNSLDDPIMIIMEVGDGTLSATIFGHETRDPSRSVSFEPVKTGTIAKPSPIYTDDSSMYEGEEEVTSRGAEGSTYTTYKVVTENGETTSEWFSSSTYNAVADRITRGTKKKPVESSSSQPEESSSEPEVSTPQESESQTEPEPAPESSPESEAPSAEETSVEADDTAA